MSFRNIVTFGRKTTKTARLEILTTEEAKERFKKFFEGQRVDDRLTVLMDLATSHQDFRREQQGATSQKRRRIEEIPSASSTSNSNGREDEGFGSATAAIDGNSDGEEEEEAVANGGDELDDEEDDEPFEIVATSGNKVLQAPRLLSKAYYKKFKIDRRACIYGGRKKIEDVANSRRFIVEEGRLRALIAHVRCPTNGCGASMDPSSIKITSQCYTTMVKAVCKGESGHKFDWASSDVVHHKTNGKSWVFSTNVAIPSAIAITGNNFAKIRKCAKAANIAFGGPSHFERMQRNAVMPVVQRFTDMAQDEMYGRLRRLKKHVVLVGDGQFDSPGSCAKTCTYTMAVAGLEYEKDEKTKELLPSGYVIAQTVLDRRHTCNSSPPMEHAAMHSTLRKLYNAEVPVDELTTDEHSQVVSDFKVVAAAEKDRRDGKARKHTKTKTHFQSFREMVDTPLHPTNEDEARELLKFYVGIEHNLDIWHKAKNVRKNLSKIATRAPTKPKDLRPTYRKMAVDLQTHLWYAAEKSENDPAKFLAVWLNALDHYQGKHENCPDACPYKKKWQRQIDDTCATKLTIAFAAEREQEVVLDPTTEAFGLLKKYVVKVGRAAKLLCKFRHTGNLESFHSTSLAYTAKLHDYDYDTMVMRKQLAVIDHNHHLHRPLILDANGMPRYTNYYSKASKSHVLAFSKEAKTYEYFETMMAAILDERTTTGLNFSGGSATFSQEHPRHIQRTLARDPETPQETMGSQISRFPANRHKIVETDGESSDVSSEDEANEVPSEDEANEVPSEEEDDE